jgi:hypothetical protein
MCENGVMSMHLQMSASTNGPDDAEALAKALEFAAAEIRAGGGDPVNHDDTELQVQVPQGPQLVFFSFIAAP